MGDLAEKFLSWAFTAEKEKLRELRLGEKGDYAIESGVINGVNASGKTIDQFGLENDAQAIAYSLKYPKQFLRSIDKHINKLDEGVDYLLLDARHFSESQKTDIMNYIQSNYSKYLNRIITIGFSQAH